MRRSTRLYVSGKRLALQLLTMWKLCTHTMQDPVYYGSVFIFVLVDAMMSLLVTSLCESVGFVMSLLSTNKDEPLSLPCGKYGTIKVCIAHSKSLINENRC